MITTVKFYDNSRNYGFLSGDLYFNSYSVDRGTDRLVAGDLVEYFIQNDKVSRVRRVGKEYADRFYPGEMERLQREYQEQKTRERMARQELKASASTPDQLSDADKAYMRRNNI
jgi:cold shock CspA family protein